MDWLETLILIVHVVISIALVGMVLLQHGKGADAGAAFGSGASQTVFGSSGSVGFLTKMTTVLALLFFVTSFSLAVFAKHKSEILVKEQGIPVPELTSESASDAKATDVKVQKDSAQSDLGGKNGDAKNDNAAPELE